MRNVWDYLEIGLLKMPFSTAADEYMDDKKKRLRAICETRRYGSLCLLDKNAVARRFHAF